MNNYQELATIFLNKVFEEIKDLSIKIPAHKIDHLCYRTSSLEHYDEIKTFFATQGILLTEGNIGGRAIATYKLNQPIIYPNQSIEVVEVPSPKDGSDYQAGFEHFEVVIDKPFDQFILNHSNIIFDTKAANKEYNPDIKLVLKSGSIKFHHQSLEKVIQEELCRK